MIEPTFKIKPEIKKADYGKFIIAPLAQGYGHTLGNSLRRVLLTSLEGAAVTEVKIKGVRHQFSTITGVSEDIVEIILNIKKIKLKLEGEKPVKVNLSAKGPGEVKAGDIKTTARVEIVNKDLVLAHLSDKKTKLEIEMRVEKGLGYVSCEERKSEETGAIPIDSIFTPVIRVNYKVEETRVGRITNLDRLILEVWTDGTVDCFEVVKEAARILVSYFRQIYKPKKAVQEKSADVSFLSEEVLETSIEELELPTRVTNALLRERVNDLNDLISTKKTELLKIKNMGAKSVSLIEKKLLKKGLKLVG